MFHFPPCDKKETKLSEKCFGKHACLSRHVRTHTAGPCATASLYRCMVRYLLGAEPEGQGVAHVERREEHAVADTLGHPFLDSCVVGPIQVLAVARQLDLLRVQRGHRTDAAEHLDGGARRNRSTSTGTSTSTRMTKNTRRRVVLLRIVSYDVTSRDVTCGLLLSSLFLHKTTKNPNTKYKKRKKYAHFLTLS